MVRGDASQMVLSHRAIKNPNSAADVDIVKPDGNHTGAECWAPSLARGTKCILKVPAQAGVNDRDWIIIEVAHQDYWLIQVLAQQNRVAEQAVALEPPLPHGQAEVAVEHVQYRAWLHFEISP